MVDVDSVATFHALGEHALEFVGEFRLVHVVLHQLLQLKLLLVQRQRSESGLQILSVHPQIVVDVGELS